MRCRMLHAARSASGRDSVGRKISDVELGLGRHPDQLPLLRLGETGPFSQGVQVRRKALRLHHTNGMEVRKKRPRGFKKRPRGFK